MHTALRSRSHFVNDEVDVDAPGAAPAAPAVGVVGPVAVERVAAISVTWVAVHGDRGCLKVDVPTAVVVGASDAAERVACSTRVQYVVAGNGATPKG